LLVNDLELITQAARAAGDIAMGFFQKILRYGTNLTMQGPVTEADLAVDKMLSAALCLERPEYGWLSEETEDGAERLHKEQVFIVDPIDGTRAFIAGTEHWSHSLAVAKAGQIQAAAVYLPVLDMMFSASLGAGAFLNGVPISVSPRAETQGADILSAKSNFDPEFWPGWFPGFKTQFSLFSGLSFVLGGQWSLRRDADFTADMGMGCRGWQFDCE
jgi:myo-inositol-1(or 4)-monophosphatase